MKNSKNSRLYSLEFFMPEFILMDGYQTELLIILIIVRLEVRHRDQKLSNEKAYITLTLLFIYKQPKFLISGSQPGTLNFKTLNLIHNPASHRC